EDTARQFIDARGAHAEVRGRAGAEVAIVAGQHVARRTDHFEVALTVLAADAIAVGVVHCEVIAPLGQAELYGYQGSVLTVRIGAAAGQGGATGRGQGPRGLRTVVVQGQ